MNHKYITINNCWLVAKNIAGVNFSYIKKIKLQKIYVSSTITYQMA
jgi:hypothetical protein